MGARMPRRTWIFPVRPPAGVLENSRWICPAAIVQMELSSCNRPAAIVQMELSSCNRPDGFVQMDLSSCNRPDGFVHMDLSSGPPIIAALGLQSSKWICAASFIQTGLFQSNWICPDKACVLHRSIGHTKPRIQAGLLHKPVQIGWTSPAKTGKCPHPVQKYFRPCPEKSRSPK